MPQKLIKPYKSLEQGTAKILQLMKDILNTLVKKSRKSKSAEFSTDSSNDVKDEIPIKNTTAESLKSGKEAVLFIGLSKKPLSKK